MYMKKNITVSQNKQNFESVGAICNLHLFYNFAFMLHDNRLVFSQSKVHNFFMYIILGKNYVLVAHGN